MLGHDISTPLKKQNNFKNLNFQNHLQLSQNVATDSDLPPTIDMSV